MYKGGRQDSLGYNYSEDEFKPGKPIMFKIKFLPRRLKTKWSSLWVVKEIIIDGTIELESPYSRRIKVITRKLLQ